MGRGSSREGRWKGANKVAMRLELRRKQGAERGRGGLGCGLRSRESGGLHFYSDCDKDGGWGLNGEEDGGGLQVCMFSDWG